MQAHTLPQWSELQFKTLSVCCLIAFTSAARYLALNAKERTGEVVEYRRKDFCVFTKVGSQTLLKTHTIQRANGRMKRVP